MRKAVLITASVVLLGGIIAAWSLLSSGNLLKQARTQGQRAMLARTAVLKGDFALAAQALALAAGGSNGDARYLTLGEALEVMVPSRDPAFLLQTDHWIEASGDTALPYIVRAQYEFNTALTYRGGGFVNEIKPDSMHAFEENSVKSWKDLEKAAQRDPGIPYLYLEMMGISGYIGNAATNAQLFKAAVARFPHYAPLYTLRLRQLAPKWGGSVPQMLAFINQYTPEDGLLPVHLYLSLAYDLHVNCQISKGISTQECVRGMDDFLRGASLQQPMAAGVEQAKRTNRHRFNEDLIHAVCNTCNRPDLKAYEEALLGQLEKLAGADDYAISYAKGAHALKYGDGTAARAHFVRSLHQTEAFDFPSIEAKNRALERAYDALVRSFTPREATPLDNTKALKFAESAVANDDTNANYYFDLCKLQFLNGQYPSAVQSCSRSLALQDDVSAHFYRGSAYINVQKLSEAQGDLEAAFADRQSSTPDARKTIFDELLFVYRVQKKYSEKVKLYGAYPETLSPSDPDAAAHYSDRCDAYYQLGDFRKAVADCETALSIKPNHDTMALRDLLVAKISHKEIPELPLITAIDAKQNNMVRRLIDESADINAQNNYGRTPLMEALDKRDWDSAGLLLQHKADVKNPVDDNEEDSLFHAVKNACPLHVFGPANGEYVKECPSDSWKRVTEIVENMLLSGAPSDRYNNLGQTAYTLSVSECMPLLAERLLMHGAEVDQFDKKTMQTPLSNAASFCGVDMVGLLLKYHANAYYVDSNGWSVLDHAHKSRIPNGPDNDAVIKLIESAPK